MTPVDIYRWGTCPKLREVSLGARAAWLLLRYCDYPVPLDQFMTLAAVTPTTAGIVLAELIEAGLVEMEGPPTLNPTMLALPAFDETLPIPQPADEASNGRPLH